MNFGSMRIVTSILKPISCFTVEINPVFFITKRCAGHSKWSNIKHTKSLKDNNRAIVFQRLRQKIVAAVKESGANPDFNSKLRAYIEEAKRLSMPGVTIQNAINNAHLVSKPYWLAYARPDGLVLGIETVAHNCSSFVSKVNQHTKKLNLKHSKVANDYFNEMGIILCKPNKGYDKAIEDGINVGADEVEETEDKTLVFQCQPNNVNMIEKKLSDFGYEILSATTEIEFNRGFKIVPQEEKLFENIINKLQDIDDLVRIVDNIIRE